MKPMFTPEELAELAAFDAQVDEEALTMEAYRAQRERDKAARLAEMPEKQRKRKEQIAAYQRQYYAENPDKYEKHKAKMREYMRKRRAAKKGEKTHETRDS